MSAHRLVSVLIGSVGDGVVLAIITGVGESALDGDSGRLSDLLQLALGVGRDSVSSLVAKGTPNVISIRRVLERINI